MSNNESKNRGITAAKGSALLEEERISIDEFHREFGPLSPDALSGEDVLTAHLRVTAPDGLMEGYGLQEGSCKLYLALDPKNAIQAMLAVLAIDTFNASFAAFADGNMKNIPTKVRDVNLRNGTNLAMASATLLEKFHRMRYGSPKSFRVGRVNVEAGGQAIVGNVRAGRRQSETTAPALSRPRKGKGSGKSGSGKVA